jgi:uncharacterized protein YcnI
MAINSAAPSNSRLTGEKVLVAGNFPRSVGDIDSMRTSCKHALLSAALSVTVVLAVGGVASAHINPDPTAVEAGSTATVGFTIEHGCDGSPTTVLKFAIPEGVTGVAPVGKEGWTTTVTGNVVEFTGGPLAPDQHDHFDITFTAPSQPGDIRFPVIQTCETGELAWIEVAAEGAPEPDHPAPTLKVTDGPPTSADLVPEAEGADANATAATGGAPTDTGATVVPVAATVAPAANDSSNTGTIVVVVVVVAVVLIGGGVLLARRRNTTN